MRRLMAIATLMAGGAAVLMAAGSCNTTPATTLIDIIFVQPQIVASTGTNVVANPGQSVTLDGSASGALVGGSIFLPATQIGMTFSWVIDAAFDANGNAIVPIPADATLTNTNASQAIFKATTIADYDIQLTCTAEGRTGQSSTGVRVIAP